MVMMEATELVNLTTKNITHKQLDYIKNVKRMSAQEIGRALSVGISAIRVLSKKLEVKCRNDHPEFIRLIKEYDNSTNNKVSLDKLSVRFRIGRKEMSKIVPKRRLRGLKWLELNVKAVEEFLSLHTKSETSKHFCVGVSAIDEFIDNHPEAESKPSKDKHAKDKNVETIIDLIKEDYSNQHIAEMINVKCSRVNYVRMSNNLPKVSVEAKKKYNMHRWGVEFYSQTPRMIEKSRSLNKTLDDNKMASMYLDGIPLIKISKTFKVSDLTIAARLRKQGISLVCKEDRLNTIKEKSNKDIIVKLNNKFGSTFAYNKHDLDGWGTKIEFGCSKHGAFKSSPSNILATVYGCKKCANVGPSKVERDIANYIKTITTVEQSNRSIICPKELDILCPNEHIAVEVNGVYWHSSSDISKDARFRTKHLHKTKECLKQGIDLIHIWDTEWKDPIKQPAWKGLFQRSIGESETIKADELIELNTTTAEEFQHVNNVTDTNIKKCKHCGIISNGELVQVTSYYANGSDCSIIQHSTLNGYNCNGLSQMCIPFDRVEFIADRRLIWNEFYDAGFKVVKTTNPKWNYVNPQGYITNTKPNTISEMYSKKYRRLWDCGSLILEKINQ